MIGGEEDLTEDGLAVAVGDAGVEVDAYGVDTFFCRPIASYWTLVLFEFVASTK